MATRIVPACYAGNLWYEREERGESYATALETGDIVLVNANGLLLAMRGNNPQTPAGEQFNPFRVGIDHRALAVADPAELEGLRQQLDAAGVRNNGIEVDALTGGNYISFYDPDGIAWELYFIAVCITGHTGLRGASRHHGDDHGGASGIPVCRGVGDGRPRRACSRCVARF